jgi:hypothetical protein
VDRKWIADFTYVWTAEGCLYVAAVIDLFSRQADASEDLEVWWKNHQARVKESSNCAIG